MDGTIQDILSQRPAAWRVNLLMARDDRRRISVLHQPRPAATGPTDGTTQDTDTSPSFLERLNKMLAKIGSSISDNSCRHASGLCMGVTIAFSHHQYKPQHEGMYTCTRVQSCQILLTWLDIKILAARCQDPWTTSRASTLEYTRSCSADAACDTDLARSVQLIPRRTRMQLKTPWQPLEMGRPCS